MLKAFQDLAGLGYREVVLTGVDLGQYGLDHAPPVSLAALVRRLAAQALPFRVRLSSLEPMMVTPELLGELAAWGNFCPHFHLPLQSGAAPILAAMGRPYAPEEFRDLVREITRRFPGPGLGLDVLVGFPGETDADFEATRSLVSELPVTYLHVFPYSPRPGTPAADLPSLPGRRGASASPDHAGVGPGPEETNSLRPNWARSGKSWWKARRRSPAGSRASATTTSGSPSPAPRRCITAA